MNRARPKQIKFRVTEDEFEYIKTQVEKSGLTQNEYITNCLLDKEIYVIKGLKEMTLELKRIGNNVNQITRAVHEGKANCSEEVEEVQKELKEIWQSLRLLIQKQL